jgi:hypothetical protein
MIRMESIKGLSLCILAIAGSLAMATMAAGTAGAAPPLGQTVPNFMPAVYGDGEVWGTKGTTPLPEPTENNAQSFDKLYVISNGMGPTQLPVAEAAPGNIDYDGGRWDTVLAVWTVAPPVAPLTSADEVLDEVAAGNIVLMGHPMGAGAPPPYFQCPLLPTR